MDRFDVARLTDFDFERICKDLFEAELGLPLEIFAPGPDSGIDLRHLSSGGSLVIQCKHWHRSARSSLIRHIENTEVPKVARLAPDRYILATSVDLTVKAKKSLHSHLTPYLLSQGDLWGIGELEAALARNDDIVRRHLRLWMSSTTVLQSLLNKEILLRSSNLLDEINETLLRYAPSAAFAEAQVLLEERKVCVISGIPGIGKTTLAQVLAAQYVSDGYELIEISKDVGEALNAWDDEKLQIFYYDDFLGQTSLRDTVATNEDSRLIRFIKQVERAGNKRFVLTTREYILAQARQHSEKLDVRSLEVTRYLLDLASYSQLARAEVLYNHIYFSQLPRASRAAFADEEAYRPIIEHRNFNPRLIALTLDSSETLSESPNEAVTRVLDNLDDPRALWDHMFKYQLDDAEIGLAEVIFLARRPLNLSDLTLEWTTYLKLPDGPQRGREVRKALASLEGTLVRIDRHELGTVVQLHNPSVRDYMRWRFSESSGHLDRSLRHVTRLEQLETLWVTATGHEGDAVLTMLRERSQDVERLFLSTTSELQLANWTSDWAERVTRFVEIADTLESEEMATSIANMLEDRRPDYLQEVIDLAELFRAIRSSSFEQIRRQEDALLEWVVSEITEDLSDWNYAQVVAEVLTSIGGPRAIREAAYVEQRLDDLAMQAAQRLAESGALSASQGEASEMLDRLSAYERAEEDFVGFRELADAVEAGRAKAEEQSANAPHTRPGVTVTDDDDEAEHSVIAAIMESLRNSDQIDETGD